VGLMEAGNIAAIWVISVLICAVIDVPFFIKRNAQNFTFGMFLIFCPFLNIVYSLYIIIKYGRIDFKEFL
jgi:hypothetical protein